MTWLRILASRARALLRKNRLDREMNEELQFHLDLQTEQYWFL